METSWLSLLPPLAVVISAFVTNRINPSLALGILTACLVGAQFSPMDTIELLVTNVWRKLSTPDSLYLYAFLFTIGVLITLLNYIGAAAAFAKKASARLQSKKGAQKFSMLVSVMLSIDDYLSILTTGYVMQSITDRFGVARLKLAFLVHSLASPLVIIAPYSSWVPVLTSNIDSPSYIASESLLTYLMTIPFIFYSFLALTSAWFIVQKDISFGPMRHYEELGTSKKSVAHLEAGIRHNSTLADLVLPLFVLVTGLVLGIPYMGGYYLLGGGSKTLMQAIQENTAAQLIMLVCVTAALLVGIVRAVFKRQLQFVRIPRTIWNGILLMAPAVLMVFLAATLSDLLTDTVKAGDYLASILLGNVSLPLLPVMFFVTSVIITMATGSSWGTFSLVPPMAIPITLRLAGVSLPALLTTVPLILPVLGAVLAGAICGDHLSPFSETTIMTATSTGTRPFDHARTQFFYMAPAILGSLVAFVIAGYLASWSPLLNIGISLSIGMTLCLGVLMLLNKSKKQ